MLTPGFLQGFKKATETKWRESEPDPSLYGFQIQKGTQWLPGLSAAEITEYETALGFPFSDDVKNFCSALNGLDTPSINLYGTSGQPPAFSHVSYSYPRDVEAARHMIVAAKDDFFDLAQDSHLGLNPGDHLLPIYGHRYAVCGANPQKSRVLSILGIDAIIYGETLESYLVNEFLADQINI